MNKNKCIEYFEAIKTGPAMSAENFFHHGVPGIDDEAPWYLPDEIRISGGILVYRMEDREIFGYRHTPWIGDKQIKLIPEEKRNEVESELKKILSIPESVNFSFR